MDAIIECNNCGENDTTKFLYLGASSEFEYYNCITCGNEITIDFNDL